jgi:hypothetical protein
LSVFDVTGRKLETLVEGQLTAGEHEARFNDKGKGKGVYIARLEYISGGRKYTETLRLLKLND